MKITVALLAATTVMALASPARADDSDNGTVRLRHANADCCGQREPETAHRRTEEAEQLTSELIVAAQAKAQPWSLARAMRCSGLLADDAALSAHFERALEHHAQTPDEFETARTRLAYGGRLRRARNRVLAREQLRLAVETFERLDARPWADRARAELAATGETVRRRDPSTIDELTPQELQIGLLLAGGRTTRETAAALFLSPKTVEYHLRHVYQKLGVHSREELARALASQTREAEPQEPVALA